MINKVIDYKKYYDEKSKDNHLQVLLIELKDKPSLIKALCSEEIKSIITILLGIAETSAMNKLHVTGYCIVKDKNKHFISIEAHPSSALGHPIYDEDSQDSECAADKLLNKMIEKEIKGYN